MLLVACAIGLATGSGVVLFNDVIHAIRHYAWQVSVLHVMLLLWPGCSAAGAAAAAPPLNAVSMRCDVPMCYCTVNRKLLWKPRIGDDGHDSSHWHQQYLSWSRPQWWVVLWWGH